MPPSSRLVVIIPARSAERIAGLPAAVRAAEAAAELSPARIVFADADASFLKRWRRHLRKAWNVASCDAPTSADGAVLTLAADGFPGAEGLARFAAFAGSRNRPARWVYNGKLAAAFRPDGAPEAPDAEIFQDSDWFPEQGAEARLFAKLPQDSDGYLARLDRRLSMAVSKRLLPFPITPNQITTASLVIGLYGAWLLATGSYAAQVLGAFLLWSCCILDGCDGEVARLKLLCSRAGGLYDVIVDNIVHVAIFLAIPWNIHKNDPDARFVLPGILLVSGLLACMFSVWFLVLRKPQAERGEAGLIVERLASRDFIYLILILTVLGKLRYFLWAAGIGSHVFNLALWIILLRAASPKPSEPKPLPRPN